ncbi:MAG: TolC family protein [Paramuribaculum sp.]|nr:TolC family protein [Paramuribaculum sp.]
MTIKSLAVTLSALTLSVVALRAETWSLDSCISYARTHNINVLARMADIESGKISYDQARDAFLPTVSGGANQSFSFGRGLTADNTYANRNTSSFGVNASLSLPVSTYFGSGQAAVKAAKLSLNGLLRQCEVARDNVELNVLTQYLQVVYSRELLEVARSQTQLSQRQLDERRQLLEAGKIAPLDVTQAESQLAQDKLSEVTANNDLRLALVNLATLLELNDRQRETFDVAPVDTAAFMLIPSVDEVIDIAMANNNSILASADNVALARQQITVAKTSYIPSVGFSAGLGSSYYRLGGGYENESFSGQMRHNFSQSLGLSLSVPLFDAFSRRNNVRSARTRHFAAQLSLDNARQQLRSSIIEAHTQAMNASERQIAASAAASAALSSLYAVDEKYRYGRATPTEVEQAKNIYVNAASTAVRAKYEKILRLRILDFYSRR